MIKFFSTASLIVASVLLAQSAYAGTLSCSITTQTICNNTASTTVFRMSGAFNAHAELASGVNGNYDANVVCCTGVTGLGYSCSTGATTTIVKLSGTTNAHAEQSGQANYANNACLSVGASGSVLVGYRATDCNTYDTTLFSMSGAGLTNTHVGSSTAYSNKVCASATGTSGLTSSATLTSSLFDSTGSVDGGGYNSIMWDGSIGTGKVKFQFATSDCTNGATNYPTCTTGSWSYIGGPSCGTGDWFDAPTPLTPVELKGTACQTAWNNKRYYRYKVQLCSASDCTSNGSTSPVVSKIVVSWAP